MDEYLRNCQEAGVAGGREQGKEVGEEERGKVKGADRAGPCGLRVRLWLLL